MTSPCAESTPGSRQHEPAPPVAFEQLHPPHREGTATSLIVPQRQTAAGVVTVSYAQSPYGPLSSRASSASNQGREQYGTAPASCSSAILRGLRLLHLDDEFGHLKISAPERPRWRRATYSSSATPDAGPSWSAPAPCGHCAPFPCHRWHMPARYSLSLISRECRQHVCSYDSVVKPSRQPARAQGLLELQVTDGCSAGP